MWKWFFWIYFLYLFFPTPIPLPFVALLSLVEKLALQCRQFVNYWWQCSKRTTGRQTAAGGAARPSLFEKLRSLAGESAAATSAERHEVASRHFESLPSSLPFRSRLHTLTAIVCLLKTSAPLRAALRLCCRRRRRRRLFSWISFFRISLQQKQFAFVFPRVRTRSRVCVLIWFSHIPIFSTCHTSISTFIQILHYSFLRLFFFLGSRNTVIAPRVCEPVCVLVCEGFEKLRLGLLLFRLSGVSLLNKECAFSISKIIN